MGFIGSMVACAAVLLPLEGAIAQSTGNQSDNTGPTVTEPSIEFSPPDSDSGAIDAQIIEYAQQLSLDLDRARIDCENSRQLAIDTPRRFARGPGPIVCVSPDCERLRVLTVQARDFLDNLDAAQAERLRQIQTLTLW